MTRTQAASSSPVLVTGATGTVGGALAAELARRGVAFRALVRDPGRAAKIGALPGAQLVTADLDDPQTLAPALAGVERAFLVTPSTARAEAQQHAFVAAARAAGVRHVVKLSQWAADAASPVRFLRYHAAIEAALRDSGMAYTFLRPNLFMQNLLALRDAIATQGAIFAAAGDAQISTVDVRDIAQAAAAALLDDGHAGRTYDLTGPAALTHAQMAAELAEGLARPVKFVDLSPEAMRGALTGFGFDAWQADGLIEDYAHYRRQEAAEVSDGVRAATGHAPRSFATFVRDHAAQLAG